MLPTTTSAALTPGESIGGSGSAYKPFQFTGVYRDSATSLYRMTQRYYQPSAGRFTQFDPLPESVMLPNRYEYAGCNPSNYVDPSGLVHQCDAFVYGAIGVALVLGAGVAIGGYFATAAAATAYEALGGVLAMAGGASGVLGGGLSYLDCMYN